MKLMNLKIDDYSYIKYINIKDNSLKIHLLEIGLVYNTKIRLLYKDSNIVVINYRNTNILLSKDIAINIEVYDSFIR